MSNPLFVAGSVVATPGALEAMEQACQNASEFLTCHLAGDWGTVSDGDRAANDESLADGSRLLSAYLLHTGVKIWILTEAADDHGIRAATTILLPDEY
jgi:hypothetical protein